MPVSPIPPGYRTLTPGCSLPRSAQAIELYQRVFGARVRSRLEGPGGTVAHAELEIGEPTPEHPAHGARLIMYVPDVDAVFARAVAAGFTALEPVADQFWGDRAGRLRDPHGNEWFVATHVEDVSEAELQARMARLFGGG